MRSAIPELYITCKPDKKKMTNDDREKANILGNYFSSVYSKEPEWTWILEEEEKPIIRKELNLVITKEAIRKKMSELKANKSPGPDSMHPRVMKELVEVLVNPLYLIFQLSIKLGKIPTAWKLANVSAIYKNIGSKHCPEHFRPISLTSIACKILESIIREAILAYIKDNSILSDKQFGFLSGRSTVLQLLRVIDRWTEILDNGGVIDAIFCDFKKAFDTVPHNRLMDLLSYYGIKNPVLSWIRDFLTCRKQHVTVNGSKSAVFDVPSGVPQGSVLGPLLFVIFINSMVVKSGNSDLYLYADDLKIFNEIKGEEDIETLQQDLEKLYDWSQYSLLTFHPDKCVVMRIAKNQKKLATKPYYNMDDTRLKTVEQEKDLGVVVDSQLKFEEHITRIVKKANSVMGMIRRSCLYLDKDMFKKLFIAMVRPHLEYGATIWNPHLKKQITLIENVQRRASKQIPGLAHLSYRERLQLIKLPTLQYRRYRGDMIELYKLSHGHYDEGATRNFLDFRANQSRDHNFRRHKYHIHKESCKKDV